MITNNRRVTLPVPVLIPVLFAAVLFGATACSDDGDGNSDGGDLPPGPLPCDALPIKTARAPRLLWSCQRQNFLEQLRASNHPQWQELISLADRTDTGNQIYGDNGGYAALAYQVTGDVKYATKGMNALIKDIGAFKKFDSNYTREFWTETAVLYDWMQGGATADQRKQVEDVLYGWYDQFIALDKNAPIRTTDTDQTTGNYFGIIATALATENNARSKELLANPFVGGYDATGSDLKTLRNAVKKYVSEWAVGGVWVESATYDVNTLQLLILGVEAVRTATGKDSYPEINGDQFYEQVVRSQMSQLTPDLLAEPKWSDVEDVRDPLLWRRYACLGVATGSLADSNKLRPMATQMTLDVKAASQAKKEPVYGWRYYFFFNPAAEVADWRKQPLSHYASGQGMVFAHDGYATSDSLFFAHLRRAPMGVDHETQQFGDFQLWRKGAWVMTRPLGYGGGAADPLAINGMVIAGLDGMQDRSTIGENAAADGSHVYFAGTNKGTRYAPPYFDPPPAFINESTRSFLYLPTTGRTADTIVVYDRVDAATPTKIDRYQGNDMALIKGAPKLKQWVFHTPTTPFQTATGFTWAASGQMAELTPLAPAMRDASTVDEHSLNWPANYPPETEKHYYTAISPKTAQQYDTFLNVLQFSDAAIAQKPARIASADNGMEGARVSRPGQGDAVALFSATAGTRVRSTEFSVSVNSTTDGFDLYVADLDPTKSWSADPGGDLHVDASGFGHTHVDGSGAVNITVKP